MGGGPPRAARRVRFPVRRFDDAKFGLSVAFAALTALLAFVAWVGLERLDRLHATTRDLDREHWSKVQLAHEAMRTQALNNRIAMQVFLEYDPEAIRSLLAQRSENSDTITRLIESIEPPPCV